MPSEGSIITPVIQMTEYKCDDSGLDTYPISDTAIQFSDSYFKRRDKRSLTLAPDPRASRLSLDMSMLRQGSK